MDYIDIATWDRKVIFNNYLGTDFPYIMMGADIDVTNLYHFAKKNNLSFYMATVFVAHAVANRIKNFRYRFKDGKPYLLDYNLPVVTHKQPESELFVLVSLDNSGNIVEFCRKGAEKCREKIEGHGLKELYGKEDAIIYSVIPWVHFNFLVRTIAKHGVDCAPRIAWGKFEKKDGKLMMPVALQVHHGLMDGYHVGLYYQGLQSYIDNQEWLAGIKGE
jgi:chloramphenicol O-acetyltransferase type A